MCDSTYVPRNAAAPIPRPRWGLLYGVVFLGLAALFLADMAPAVMPRPIVESVLALATFAAVGLWVRGSRAALDQHEWCECAADTIMVRVIPSRRLEVREQRASRVMDPATGGVDRRTVVAPGYDARRVRRRRRESETPDVVPWSQW